MREHSIVADFLRHPKGFLNRLLEPLFVRADHDLRLGDFTRTERELRTINAILDMTGH